MQRFFIDVLSFILFPAKIFCPLQVIFLFSSLSILREFTIMKIQHRQHKRYSECTSIICCYFIRLYLLFYSKITECNSYGRQYKTEIQLDIILIAKSSNPPKINNDCSG